jgi:DNA-binding CsgD family transcriptional regulator
VSLEQCLAGTAPHGRRACYAEGKSNKEVAAFLNLSVKTAQTHRANIMRKLTLHSLGQLIHYAIRSGIIAC